MNSNKKKLYIIGLGPGDPELVTLKGIKKLEEAKIIFVPVRNSEEGYALSILKKLSLDHKVLPLEIVMGDKKSIEKESKKICEALKNYDLVALAVLGEPSLYSTASHILSYINCRNEVEIEIVPGVSAIYACADRIPMSLAVGSEAIAIVPSSRVNTLENVVEYFDTVVIIKGGETLVKAINTLTKKDYSVIYIKHCFLENEKILSENIDSEYMALAIARKRG